MADTQSTQPQLFDVAELPGRPMLHWHGKRPLREIPYYPDQLREHYGGAGRSEDKLRHFTSTPFYQALLPETQNILRHIRRVE